MSSADFFIKFNSLPAALRKELKDHLDKLLKRMQKDEKPVRKGGVPGLAKGWIVIADHFDEPLEDFKPYMA